MVPGWIGRQRVCGGGEPREVTGHLYINSSLSWPLPEFCTGCWKGCMYQEIEEDLQFASHKRLCSLKINILGLQTCGLHQARCESLLWARCAGTRHPTPSDGDKGWKRAYHSAITVAVCWHGGRHARARHLREPSSIPRKQWGQRGISALVKG